MIDRDKIFRNKSLTFLIPMMFESEKEIGLSYLRGVFIGDKELNNEELKHKIYLMFEFNYITTLYEKDNDYYRKMKGFLSEYYPDDYRTMFVYNVPKVFEKDYYLFTESRYSEVSVYLKNKIIKFWKLTKNDLTPKILYKDPEYKKTLEDSLNTRISDDAELLDPLNEEREYFTKDKKKYKTKIHEIRDNNDIQE